jgi:hypothetical protein
MGRIRPSRAGMCRAIDDDHCGAGLSRQIDKSHLGYERYERGRPQQRQPPCHCGHKYCERIFVYLWNYVLATCISIPVAWP